MGTFQGLGEHEQELIDRICSRWESELRQGSAIPLMDVIDADMPPELRHIVVVELAMAQLDYVLSRANSETACTVAVDCLASTYDDLTRFGNARDDFGKIAGYAFELLQERELRPSVGDFVERIPTNSGMEHHVRRRLAERWPAYVQFSVETKRFSASLEIPIVVGRQRENDPEPIVIVREAQGMHRLIIARSHVTRVSRQHVRLEHACRGTVEVSNISRRSPVLVNESSRLSPGDSLMCELPSTVQLDRIVLQLGYV